MAKVTLKSERQYTVITKGKKNLYQFKPKTLKDKTLSKYGYLEADLSEKEINFITLHDGITREEV